jgi:[ribosomal protein S5]-alanine N-acetyltransferase
MRAFESPTLRTDRLVLRPLRETDAEALFAIFSDERVMRYWSTPPWTSREPAQDMIAADLAQTTRDHLRLGIELVESGLLLGTCSLFSINYTCRRAEVGYGLGSFAWGQGYMHEALQSLLEFGFGELDLNRIEADIDPRNSASARTLERLGFTKEGYLRERWIVGDEVSDTALYGLLRREWRRPHMRIPPGFNTVTPYFFVDGAEGFLEFLVRGLGGVETGRHMDGGRIANAQVRLGTSTVMVSEASAAFPAMPASYYLYVDNADDAMGKALAAGATKIMDVADMPYNDRQGGVKDPCGNLWWISERMVDGPY